MEYTYSILGIIIIIGIIYAANIYIKQKEGFKEGLGIDDFTKPFREMGDKAQEGINKTKEAFEKIGEVFEKVKGGFEDMNNFFKKIDNFGKRLGSKFTDFGKGFKKSFEGIEHTFLGFNDGISKGFGDIGKLMKYSGIYVITYMECGIKFVSNVFTYCIMFYIADIVFAIWSAVPRLGLYCLYLCGFNVYYFVDIVWSWVVWVDDLLYSYIKASPLKYTEKVQYDCYTCRRLKEKALKRVANDVNNDFMNVLPGDLKRGVPDFSEARQSFINSVTW
jgi:hypothetical protein